MRARDHGQETVAFEGLSLLRLKKRRDFLRAGKGRRWHGKAFSLQVVEAAVGGEAARVGFTLTKKVGCAVVRNRIRRRLREAVRLDPLPYRAEHDYVVIGRQDGLHVPFASLLFELRTAVEDVHRRGSARPQERGAATKPLTGGTPCRASRDGARRNGSVEPGRIRPEP